MCVKQEQGCQQDHDGEPPHLTSIPGLQAQDAHTGSDQTKLGPAVREEQHDAQQHNHHRGARDLHENHLRMSRCTNLVIYTAGMQA